MKFIFIIICLAVSVICNAQNNNSGTIKGIVEGSPRVDIDLLLNTFEKRKSKTNDEVVKVFTSFNKKYGQKSPLSGVKVVLQGQNIQKEIKTDNKGNFLFANLPYGKYLIMASVPNWIGVYPNTKTVATESKFINVKGNNPKYVVLTPDVLHVDLYGKVISENKQPVVGAKVIATWIYPQKFLEQKGIPTWETITDKNGNYEFKGLPPSSWFRIASALVSTKKSYSGIKIEAIAKNGLKGKLAKLPLVSQDVLYVSKRFCDIFKDKIKTSNTKHRQNTDAFIKSLPKSKGNDIFVSDIIVDCAKDRKEK
jgi:Prealbumin-like fold domain